MRWLTGSVLMVFISGMLLACSAPAATPTVAPPPSGTGSLAGGTHGLPPAVETAPAVTHLRIPYSAVGGSTSPLPLARDAGLFSRYGLDVELVSIPGSSVVVQSMIAGELPISAVSSAAVVEADLAGADIAIIAGVVNRIVNMVMAVPAVGSIAELRDRRVGVPRLGDSTDFLTRYALRQNGLEPDRDVAILQIGGNSEVLAAMQAGALDAGTLPLPANIQARRLGYRQLIDLADLGIPYQHTTLNVTRSYLREHPDVVRRFLKAYVEALYLFRADKGFTQKVLAEFTRVDDAEVLEETWQAYATRYFERVPYPTLEGLQTVLNESPQPMAKEARPEQFVDLGLMHELEGAGFFEELRTRYGE